MKKEWQEVHHKAQYVINIIHLQNVIGFKMQVINRNNELIFQTKQTGKDINEAYHQAFNECAEVLSEVDIFTIFTYNPYWLDCKFIKVPHYESKKV